MKIFPNPQWKPPKLLPGVATPRGWYSQGAYTNIRCCSAEIYTGDAVLLEYIIRRRCCSAGIYKGDAGSGDPWEWRPQTVSLAIRQISYSNHTKNRTYVSSSGIT